MSERETLPNRRHAESVTFVCGGMRFEASVSRFDDGRFEALPPNVIAELLDDAIRLHLDNDQFEADLERENEDRQKLRYLLPSPEGAP